VRFPVRGEECYAYTGGRPLAADQPTLLFVHGAANDHSVWALQSRYFAHHGCNALAVDLPGHGRSSGSPLATIEEIADWLVDVLDAVGVAQAAIIGHSLGALATLACAARHSSRTTRIALLGPAVPMPVSEALLAAAEADDHLAFELINSWSFGPAAQLGGNPVPGMWMVGSGLRLMERTRPGVLHVDLLACRQYAAGLEAAAAVACPVLVILGARDGMAPVKGAQALLAALRDRRVVTLPQSGHALMAEMPDAVLDALREFASPAAAGTR